jgi:hypothetical protein
MILRKETQGLNRGSSRGESENGRQRTTGRPLEDQGGQQLRRLCLGSGVGRWWLVVTSR